VPLMKASVGPSGCIGACKGEGKRVCKSEVRRVCKSEVRRVCKCEVRRVMLSGEGMEERSQ
jgi:hypothetical protein